MNRFLGMLIVIGIVFLSLTTSFAGDIVTVDNFVRAESDLVLSSYVKQGGFGEIPEHSSAHIDR